MQDLTLAFSWQFKSLEIYPVLSATVFLNKLILAKACRLSAHTSSAAFNMQVLTNSPSEKVLDAAVISPAMI